jgi:hypothetical protein
LRDDQKEDPGKLVQVGYSAGSRSAPAFHWVKNLLSKRIPQEEVDAMDKRASSAFAFAWNLGRSKLPDEVIQDFDQFLADTDIKHMDARGLLVDERGDNVYTAEIGDQVFEFHGANLAPPQGVFGKNYAR